MRMALLAATVLSAASAAAQPPRACLDVAVAPVTLEGRLTRAVFPGPPNYSDTRRGDTPEPTFILVLPRAICIDDRDQQADPNARFRTVHLYSNDPALRRRLRAAVGRRLRVTGEGFAALTGHHHAPLVVEVRRVAAMRARRR